MKCRAEFDKPRYVRIQGTESPEYFNSHPGKYKHVGALCVSSLPLPQCQSYVPAVFTSKYERMYEDFKDSILGGGPTSSFGGAGGGFVAVHWRRGDRCGEGYKGKRDVLYKSGACGPVEEWVKR